MTAPLNVLRATAWGTLAAALKPSCAKSFRALIAGAGVLILAQHAAHADSTAPLIAPDCTWHGIKLYGKVQVVESFPDIKVEKVKSFPDLRVLNVTSFPDACGKWQFVESFPDFKIQYVDSFPDLKIEMVSSFPGLP